MSRQWCILRSLATIVFMVFMILLVASARAQQTTGGITGVVTDSQGGILPGANLEAVGDEVSPQCFRDRDAALA